MKILILRHLYCLMQQKSIAIFSHCRNTSELRNVFMLPSKQWYLFWYVYVNQGESHWDINSCPWCRCDGFTPHLLYNRNWNHRDLQIMI